VVSYLRSYRPERHPVRRRRRADPDAARWSYDEVDAERRPMRHIAMRADDGTYLAAAVREPGGVQAAPEHEARYGVVPQAPVPPLGEHVSEMAGEDFEHLWRLARCELDGRAEVQIYKVQPRTQSGLAVVVRCVGGRVRMGSRFDQVRETGDPVSLTVARILVPFGETTVLTPPGTATLILSGPGCPRVRAGQHLDGRTS
jgi:hypothetical protein